MLAQLILGHMDSKTFRKHAHELVDWMADYLETIDSKPVKSQVLPGQIKQKLPASPPESSEPFELLIKDLNDKIMPGVTHWQHPNFHAYFPGNSSYPSILGEMVTSTLAAQCMVWETSPAAAELEELLMDWLKEMMDLPRNWQGVIQDTASTATLVALISAREKVSNFEINRKGFGSRQLRIYSSAQIHSSIDKAVKIAGFGIENLVKVDVDEELAMIPSALTKAIEEDLEKGYMPCAVVAGAGTTGTLAFDPTEEIGKICQQFNLWYHVDAAYAGSAMIVPEERYLMPGLDKADSYVFNPHKWLFTNFDCTAYFVRDKETLIKTFEILPEYLKTGTYGKVNDYRDWGIQLGRRFRALKLWFVIRTYGVDGLRAEIRAHIKFTRWLHDQIEEHDRFQVLAPQRLNVIVFRYYNPSVTTLNPINQEILESINQSGEAYLTHTKIGEDYAMRIVLGQTNLERKHVEKVWQLVQEHTEKIAGNLH